MRNAPIVAGVPSPYTMHVHPYPTRFHGPRYTRPVFGAPVIARPQDLFTPGYNMNREISQPTLSGLGATVGEGRLWNEGEGIFKPGGYGGGVFDGDISGLGSIGSRRTSKGIAMRGLGDDSADYPWKAYSEKTKALQQATNSLLAQAALCPVAVDGKLGAGTCGARKYLNANKDRFFTGVAEIAYPSTCESFTTPAQLTSGCGNNTPKAPTSITPASTLPAPVFEAGMSSGTKRTLGFALGGVLAIGAVVLLRRKK
jgi:hypothetical protein